MMDPTSETRLGEVHPKLAERVRRMAEILAAENIVIRVVQSYRSYAEQAALYAKGRDAQGNIVDSSKVVTHAKPGMSWHQFRLAVDVAPFDEGVPDWNLAHFAWQRIVAVGQSQGLVAGALWRSFPDYPHFQMTGTLPTSPDDQVRTAYEVGGIDAVWKDAGLET